MLNDFALMPWIMGGIVGAVFLTGALIVAGRWMIRAAGMVEPPPERCRYEPPPPEASPPAGAEQRAQERAALAAVYADAWNVLERLRDCDACMQRAQAVADAAATATCTAALATARQAHVAVDALVNRGLTTADHAGVREHLLAAATAAANAQAAVSVLPDPEAARTRRMLWLLLIAVLMSGLMLAMRLLLPTAPAYQMP